MAANWPNAIKELINTVARELRLFVRNYNMVAGAAIGAACAGVGSFFGPVGTVAGAAVGVVTAAWLTADEERPLTQVLRDLPTERAMELYTGVSALLDGLNWPDPAALQERVMRNEILLNRILSVIQSFFEPQRMVVVPRLL
ncbi:hypothetical protein KOW79_008641 [Hemibagrus wyckioides]|uniref:Uncharacterized protein n=1 Tax=Hemibagrus wyckioides TaxID=337641 RepID=A0A9D3NXH1_9TELE|nr:hypothetical protein KOW79_008641 [Hemibagrus wyckioides]